jgi:hypothetical protein
VNRPRRKAHLGQQSEHAESRSHVDAGEKEDNEDQGEHHQFGQAHGGTGAGDGKKQRQERQQ